MKQELGEIELMSLMRECHTISEKVVASLRAVGYSDDAINSMSIIDLADLLPRLFPNGLIGGPIPDSDIRILKRLRKKGA